MHFEVVGWVGDHIASNCGVDIVGKVEVPGHRCDGDVIGGGCGGIDDQLLLIFQPVKTNREHAMVLQCRHEKLLIG